MSTQPSSSPIILVDGSSYLYRAFHALPALTNSKGFPTGAIYGMVNMLKRLIKDYHPEYMAVIFDAKGKTFRDDIYPAYKATRSAMPTDLSKQIEPIHEIIAALGLPIIMIEGVEADDVIGTLCQQSSLDQNIVVSTGDKDLAQLVNEKVTLVNTMTNSILNTKTVEEKFGVTPAQIIDYLSLVGDASDNIVGVPSVGPKTAVKWLKEYGSLDQIIKHADKISGKVGESLRTSIPHLPLTKSLVTIKHDVSINLQLSDLKIKTPNKKTLIAYYKNLEFKTWLSELLNEQTEEIEDTQIDYKIINSTSTLAEMLAEFKQINQFAINVETDIFDYNQAKIIGFAFAIAPGKAFYIPTSHHFSNTVTELTDEFILEKIKFILENPNYKKIAEDFKFIIKLLAKHHINLAGTLFDTMLESYILDSTSLNHDVHSLGLKYLGHRTLTFDEIAGKGSHQLQLDQIDIDKFLQYAAKKADTLYRLHHIFWPKITENIKLKNIFENIETPMINVLAHMEQCGVLIDPKKLAQQSEELKKRLIELEKEAFSLAEQSFNINSPKQLQEILFNKLKLPILQKTPTGQPSTADNVLQELAFDFALPRVVIEYRSLSKLISTYTNRLIEQINSQTKRIHTSYNQTGTSTGRLSSSDPNLQNIPIRTLEGRRIRGAFVAPKGYRIVTADYSQIELRLMAHISSDQDLLQAFKQNLDIHKVTAAEVAGLTIDKVSTEMRRDAKAINFGLIYGMSAFGLTQQLGIDRKRAQEYIDRYFARYPKVKEYMDNMRATAREQGYVETLWGRRLQIPDIQASQMARRKAAERAAINAPLQGSAADIIKLAMIQIDNWIRQENIDAKMIMQVHDELVFEVAEKDLDQIVKGIQKYMSEVVKLTIPLIVSIGIGNNWDEASDH